MLRKASSGSGSMVGVHVPGLFAARFDAYCGFLFAYRGGEGPGEKGFLTSVRPLTARKGFAACASGGRLPDRSPVCRL